MTDIKPRRRSESTPSSSERDAKRESLTYLLGLIVAELGRVQDATCGGPGEGGGDEENYVYLELPLSEASGSEIDICIHDNKAFIRIGLPAKEA